MTLYNTLKDLCLCPSVSGRENKIREKITSYIAPLCDEISTDALGNLIAVKKGNGNGKKIMLAAHMDEVGIIVTFIEDNGMIRIAPIGWISIPGAAFSRVISEKGVRGIVVPETKVEPADYKMENFYIDIGAKDKKQAERLVSIGDFFVLAPSLDKLAGSRVCGRPLDDRIGCAVVIGIAEKLKDVKLEDDVYFVFTVQEELGRRGSMPVAFAVQPDVALCFDVTATGDTPGATPMVCSVGNGAAIKVKDAFVVCDEDIVRSLCDIAKKNKIKHQKEILLVGATDTCTMQLAGSGCAAGALSIPTRHIHSGTELCDLADAECCIELATEFIKRV
jgi:endoglucanase